MIFFVVVVCLLTTCTMGAQHEHATAAQQGPKDEIYTDQWAVHVQGGRLVADQVAHRHGFQNLGQIVQDYYHFQHRKVAKRSTEASEEHDLKLTNDPDVKWSKQQIAKKRVKRDYLDGRPTVTITGSQQLNDPRWPQMWYLNRGRGLDMNVQAAWKKGVTGKGVVVTILDDGLEKDHPDIMRNFDPQASYDVNNHDEDPQPRYDLSDSNRHGTRCAGEVAADANNSICAVGVAYDASVGGVRMLDGDVTDAVEARSLSLNPQHIDVYSASWGPDDDGKTVDGPGELASRAFLEGIQHGRRGLGSIFVWASGNGGRDHDNCNCDGYTNSIWTLSISSATENGLVPWYSEACSSTLATTYSSGSIGEKQVVTTDLHYQCTSTHTGTSASAPLAAGICALALQVNPRLTWRDMQHIVVRTARPANLRAVDWVVNGVGRNVSHSFGYGLMDASAMVDLARNWTTSPTQKMCKVPAPYVNKLIPAKSKVTLTLHVDCPDVKYLEHVQAKISLTASRRGDIQVFLTSAMGTRSCLLDIRPRDTSPAGFHSWPFMTVHNWGESPRGTWLLEIHNEGRYQAHITGWHLNMYGTKVKPGSAEAEEEAVRVANDKAKSLGVLRDPASAEDDDTSLRNGNGSDSSCSRRLSSGKCIECSGNYLLAEGECRLSCPGGFYASNGSDSNDWGPTAAACFPCHYSCKTCKGPNDYQCTSCHGDSELFKARCQPFELARIVFNANAWYYGMTATFVVMGIVILALVCYVVFAGRKDECGHVHGHSYKALHPSSLLGPSRDPEAKAAIAPFGCESDESQNEDM